MKAKVTLAALAVLTSTVCSARAGDLDDALSFWRAETHQTVGTAEDWTGLRSRRERAGETGIHAAVTRAAIANGVPLALAHGVVRVESGYNCRARHGGAVGIGQVKPATARSVGVTGNLANCETGLQASMRYLRLALDYARGSLCGAATLYNRGIGARPTSSAYCRKVLRG